MTPDLAWKHAIRRDGQRILDELGREALRRRDAGDQDGFTGLLRRRDEVRRALAAALEDGPETGACGAEEAAE